MTDTDNSKTGRGRKTAGAPDAELLARMTALGAQPAPPAAVPAAAKAARKRAASTSTGTGSTGPSSKATAAPKRTTAAAKTPALRKAGAAAAPMPAEQSRPVTYSARINLTTTPEQNRALDLARLDDGVEKTARLRAMVALWESDPRLRKRIDKAARDWR